MSKKVAQFTNRFLDISETFIYEPLRLMKKFKPVVFCFQKRNQDKFPYDSIYCLNDLPEKEQKKNQFLAAFGQEKYFTNLIKQNEIRVLHAHYGFGGIYALQFKKKNSNLKIIVNFYGLDVYQHTKSPLYRWQLRQLFKKGDLFLVCSEKMSQDLIKLGAPKNKVKVHYGGADLKKIKYSCPKQGDEIVFLMCGRFVEKKGFKYGIEAFLRCCAKNNNIKLKVIGHGTLEQALKKIVTQSKYQNRVEFLGALNHSEYLTEIEKCNVFISPSVTAKNGDQEGLPTVLIESAAIGRPLIATNYSGIPEIVHHKQNGLLVKEQDIAGLSAAIDYLAENKKLWSRYAEYGRKLVEKNFDLIKQTEKLEEYYQKLIE
ncbi:MAG: glycosyltransferase [Candidatus Margulisbacteria bacterium]|nr:glycosyltransferase [Candidatus Margulisiibacteriota bacterium]